MIAHCIVAKEAVVSGKNSTCVGQTDGLVSNENSGGCRRNVKHLSTDDPELISIKRVIDVEIIERPDYLANDQARRSCFSTQL